MRTSNPPDPPTGGVRGRGGSEIILGRVPSRRAEPGVASSEEDTVAGPLTFDIDRSSPTPLYYQLAQAIEGAISGGSLPSGSKVENEVLRYNVIDLALAQASR